ncbi:MAG TPA: ubiquitin-like protein Pup [Candidatus Saccharimonadales bacterium]|nr:ubiquitin-like protein Pup [Candidatus Saccharimonadales bacterium]
MAHESAERGRRHGRADHEDENTQEAEAEVRRAKRRAAADELGEAALTDDVDGLLDEIDTVLEENAEEFVSGYTQVNGQ